MHLRERQSDTYVRQESNLDLSCASLRDAYARYKRNGIRQRFGEWICNLYLKEGKSFPALYYARNPGVAYNLAITDILGDGQDEPASEQLRME